MNRRITTVEGVEIAEEAVQEGHNSSGHFLPRLFTAYEPHGRIY